jgi:uncharacterized membrane protein YkoI
VPSGGPVTIVSSNIHPTEEVTMRINKKLAVAAGAAAIVAGGAGAAAAAGGSDDANEGPDVAISGDALQRASEAALAETGGGRVTGSEVNDEESYYEVEVTRDDGSQVDVQLDENFAVVGSSADVENSDEGAD